MCIRDRNSVLYINKNPYVIADVQWTKGDWKIDTKIKKSQLDSSKITDPVLYQTVVKDEIISGENQLQSLPPAIIYGENYTGPKDDTNNETLSSSASGVKPVTPSTIVTPVPPATPSTIVPYVKPVTPDTSDTIVPYVPPVPPQPYIPPTLLLTDSDLSLIQI